MTIEVELHPDEYAKLQHYAEVNNDGLARTIMAFASFGMEAMEKMAEYQALADSPALGDRAKPN